MGNDNFFQAQIYRLGSSRYSVLFTQLNTGREMKLWGDYKNIQVREHIKEDADAKSVQK
jgi:hypothetical protein